MTRVGQWPAEAWRALVPADRRVRTLAVADLVGAFGFGAFAAGSAVFFTRSVGLSAAQVGIGLSVSGGLGLAAAVPAGRLCDRIGALRVIVVAALASIALFVAYAFVDSFATFLPVVALLGIANRLDRVAIGTLIAELLERDERVKVSAYLRSVNNLGMALGAALAGVAVAVDTRPAYLALPLGCAVTSGVMVFVRSRLRPPARPPRPEGAARWIALRDRPFLALTALFGLARLDSTILNVALPLWVLHHTSVPRPLVAAILIVNTCLVIVLQVRAARGSETPAGIVRAKRLACVALVAACLVIGASGSVGKTPAILLVVGGTALLTAGELWISAASWSVRYGFAAPHAQGEYGAVFSLGSSAMDLAGPAAVVLLTDRFGFAGWGAVAGAFAVVFVAIRPAVAHAAARGAEQPLAETSEFSLT